MKWNIKSNTWIALSYLKHTNIVWKSGFKEKNVSIEEIPHLDHISIEEPKQEFLQLIVSGDIFNSDDLDSAREYCKENGITFKSYDGSTGTLILEGSKDKLLETQELLEKIGREVTSKKELLEKFVREQFGNYYTDNKMKEDIGEEWGNYLDGERETKLVKRIKEEDLAEDMIRKLITKVEKNREGTDYNLDMFLNGAVSNYFINNISPNLRGLEGFWRSNGKNKIKQIIKEYLDLGIEENS